MTDKKTSRIRIVSWTFIQDNILGDTYQSKLTNRNTAQVTLREKEHTRASTSAHFFWSRSRGISCRSLKDKSCSWSKKKRYWRLSCKARPIYLSMAMKSLIILGIPKIFLVSPVSFMNRGRQPTSSHESRDYRSTDDFPLGILSQPLDLIIYGTHRSK